MTTSRVVVLQVGWAPHRLDALPEFTDLQPLVLPVSLRVTEQLRELGAPLVREDHEGLALRPGHPRAARSSGRRRRPSLGASGRGAASCPWPPWPRSDAAPPRRPLRPTCRAGKPVAQDLSSRSLLGPVRDAVGVSPLEGSHEIKPPRAHCADHRGGSTVCALDREIRRRELALLGELTDHGRGYSINFHRLLPGR